jgi:hypothetical protein
MVNRNRMPNFSAEIIDTSETIYFFIVDSVDYSEPHSIKTYVAPYTTAGRTQNLGRQVITLSYNIMLVNYFKDDKLVTIEESLQKLINIKRLRKKLRLSVPKIPLGTSRFYMGNLDVGLKEPSRLILTTSFTEILEDSIKRSVHNLVLNNSMENIKALLQQREQL